MFGVLGGFLGVCGYCDFGGFPGFWMVFEFPVALLRDFGLFGGFRGFGDFWCGFGFRVA